MATIDPITLAVVQNRLTSIANEVQATVFRCAISTSVYERKDSAFAILDAKCGTIAQDLGLAVLLGGTGPGAKNCIDFIGEENLEPGDIIIAATHIITGSHPPDGILLSPIFFKDDLFGYVATRVHWRDMGAKSHFPTDSASKYEEGIQVPPTKLFKRGNLQQDVMEIIRWNSRCPHIVWGDMRAQIAGCRIGEKRAIELLEKYGMETVNACIEEMYNYSERVIRQAVEQLPDGTWTAEDVMDDNGVDLEKPVKVKVTVTVKGSDITLDFTGSAEEQKKSPLNCPFISTQSSARAAVMSLASQDLPANEGCYRCIKVIAPEGSIYNCGKDAPTFLYPLMSQAAMEIVNKALSPVLPNKIPASSGGDFSGGGLEGNDPRTGLHWDTALSICIGQGGDLDSDGENALKHISTGAARTVPAEVLESEFPLFIEEFALETDTAGPGKHRGGVGMRAIARFLAPGSFWNLQDKAKNPTWGVNGGKPGSRNYSEVLSRKLGHREVRKATGVELDTGDTVIRHAAGGAGYGNPFERDPEAVRQDVVNGYVSLKGSRRDYGVVINPDTFIIDVEATRKLRNG